MTREVLVPEHPASVHYHDPSCGSVNADRAARLAREDAEAIGKRPHNCITGQWNGPDPDGRREVPA